MSDNRPIHRSIAQAMVEAINSESSFQGQLLAEQVADPKRRIEELRDGEMLVDCIGQGARWEPRNRRSGARTFIVWMAVHSRLPDGVVTNEALDQAGYWAELIQNWFHEPDNNSLVLDDGQRVVLTGSEPFPLSREALFGHGLHLATFQFTWDLIG